jgi:hypothetical protein
MPRVISDAVQDLQSMQLLAVCDNVLGGLGADQLCDIDVGRNAGLGAAGD